MPRPVLRGSVARMVDGSERFLGEDGLTRVTAVLLTGAVETARIRHDALDIGTVAMGRAMVCASLLGSTVRENGRVNLQLVGNGPLGTVGVDAWGNGNIRAYVRRPGVMIPLGEGERASVAAGVGRQGEVHVLLDPAGGQYSRGTSSIVSGEVDDDFNGHLEQSAQMPSATATDVLLGDKRRVVLAAGVLVQALPGSDGAAVKAARERLKSGAWSRELKSDPAPTLEMLAQAALPGVVLRSLATRELRWHCPCSRERVLNALLTLGPAELTSMLNEDGKADVSCDFCREAYDIGADDLRELIQQSTRAGEGGAA